MMAERNLTLSPPRSCTFCFQRFDIDIRRMYCSTLRDVPLHNIKHPCLHVLQIHFVLPVRTYHITRCAELDFPQPHPNATPEQNDRAPTRIANQCCPSVEKLQVFSPFLHTDVFAAYYLASNPILSIRGTADTRYDNCIFKRENNRLLCHTMRLKHYSVATSDKKSEGPA